MATAETLNRVHINRPATIAIRRIMPCPTEGVRRRFAAHDALWYGPTWTCLGCGDSFGDGERLERPFKPRWRQEAKARARELWEQGVRCGSPEHLAWLDEQIAPYRHTEDIEHPDTPTTRTEI